MKAFDYFKKTLNDISKDNISEGNVWGTVSELDWDEKTMTVISLKDGLEYFDVLLGIGSYYQKPVIGTKCLIGSLENKATSMFLIAAEQVEEILINVKDNECIVKENETVLKTGNTEAKISDKGYSFKKGGESLKPILNDWIDEVSKIIVVNGTTINVAKMNLIKQRLNSVLIA
ncbi:conserved hypothetical protein [Tenacibaculum maritimum]|uniref:hypothetical protein n=1 Tax=Tenacibaculum maritimum TaxID=107401 RepID=UPI0012E5AE31|nr:hypothetical protein [Tenacibaculum maritimum]CAA0228546.1 conserved hypothetical protein [Tenacibaculum maritimum]CAA0249303.1 conserved hypothetical protein [Tenacibaculum maritimum]